MAARSSNTHSSIWQAQPPAILRSNQSSVANSGGSDATPVLGAKRRAGRGGVSPRLDKRTYLDREQGRFSVTLRDYGGGLMEMGWSFVPNLEPFKSGKGLSEDRRLHEDRALRRARSRLRQLILAAGCDHLVSLTYRANQTDYKQACADLSAFVRKVRRYFPDWVFVAVPEKQKRGAWHWHIAVVGRQDVYILRACWRSVVGEGNIDVAPPPKRGSNKRLAMVRYLTKYLAKGFSEGWRELNGHRYRASLGIQIPAAEIPIPANLRQEVSAYLIEQLRMRSGSVGYIWVNLDGSAGWACSWD